mmetsp:Transcript_12214/g.17823  ORF Transcript_12214/g.17823 Transcript_12214/m.17823 type:complete len:349 (+) Transcript_12214:329-1375(+)
MQSINTLELLSTLIDATHHGSTTIQTLCNEARSNTIQFKEEGDARSAMTIADTTAQAVIVSSLLHKYPNLNIVGEEDESVAQVVDPEKVRELKGELLQKFDWFVGGSPEIPQPPMELDLTEVIVYVDPLDGTREFVEGRLENVQCLIGCVYRGIPLLGAVGLPFPSLESKEENGHVIEVVFGLVGKGIGKMISTKNGNLSKSPLPNIKPYTSGDTIYVSSGDSSKVKPAVTLAENIFHSDKTKNYNGMTHQIIGASGNKMLQVSYGSSTISLQGTGTSLWDTAAPSAILFALGGKVTDYFGNDLVYGTNKGQLGNKRGVISSAPGAKGVHLDMVEAMGKDDGILSLRD